MVAAGLTELLIGFETDSVLFEKPAKELGCKRLIGFETMQHVRVKPLPETNKAPMFHVKHRGQHEGQAVAMRWRNLVQLLRGPPGRFWRPGDR